MPNLIDIISDTFPANGDIGVPLRTTVTISFSEQMDETSLTEGFFLEGPDTDQFVGPGLLDLQFPDNISQGELDDFLMSPGYKGIAAGDLTFETVSGVSTKLIFTSDQPLAALTDYTATIVDVKDFAGTTYSGHLTFSFQTGSGSIQEIPSTVSTSILSTTATTGGSSTVLGSGTAFKVLSVTPADRSVENSPTLTEIVVEFNKDIDPALLIDEQVLIQTIETTDHPAINIKTTDKVVKSLQINGRILTIKI